MGKTLVDLDPDLLIRAQQIFGATTKKETVNRALREIVRREAAARFLQYACAGIFACDNTLDRDGQPC